MITWISDIKRAKDAVPFKPFDIRTADGREVVVSHPDAVSWDDAANPTTLMVIVRGGRWEMIDVGLVTGLGVMAPESKVSAAKGDSNGE